MPEPRWTYHDFGKGYIYADNQAEDRPREPSFAGSFDAWADRLAEHAKGKVQQGKYRAYGYRPPKHRWADAKLKWRELRMSAGLPPSDSSPAAQQAHELNHDASFSPKASVATRSNDAPARNRDVDR